MRRNIRVSEPSAEMQVKIKKAVCAVSNQKSRLVKCPYHDIFKQTERYLAELSAKEGDAK